MRISGMNPRQWSLAKESKSSDINTPLFEVLKCLRKLVIEILNENVFWQNNYLKPLFFKKLYQIDENK